MTKINRELLIGYYNHKISLKHDIINLLKLELVVNVIFTIALINFIGFSIEIIYALLLVSLICLIGFSAINLFSAIEEKIRDTICTNKINRNEFYIIKDSVQDIIETSIITNEDPDSGNVSTEDVLKIQFSNKKHWFYTDKDTAITKGDEYYIILFKKGIYQNRFEGPLINPRIINFLDCKAYNIDYEQYWKDGILEGKYIK